MIDGVLSRWRARGDDTPVVACVGDSITQGAPVLGQPVRGWVAQLASALDAAAGGRRSDGFRALWRRREWTQSGSWERPTRADPFDVAPFGWGFYSSGSSDDRLRWTRPADVAAACFDLFWFGVPGTGAFQVRVDDAGWLTVPQPERWEPNRLHRAHLDGPVEQTVEIRGHDGHAPCIAPIAGLTPYTAGPSASAGATVHNLGLGQATIEGFCADTDGNRLALLDELRPDLVTLLFSNDVVHDDPDSFEGRVDTVVVRVQPYADVLLLAPFEQRPTERVVYEGDLRIGTRDPAMQARYRAVIHRVAEARGCALVDLYDAWAASAGPGWESARAAGLMLDELHPSQTGHDDVFGRVRAQLGI
jgi:lysophospholipase L1-like esterase